VCSVSAPMLPWWCAVDVWSLAAELVSEKLLSKILSCGLKDTMKTRLLISIVSLSQMFQLLLNATHATLNAASSTYSSSVLTSLCAHGSPRNHHNRISTRTLTLTIVLIVVHDYAPTPESSQLAGHAHATLSCTDSGPTAGVAEVATCRRASAGQNVCLPRSCTHVYDSAQWHKETLVEGPSVMG
jgi:hypothetical protein